jgi:hypothetical protein
MVLLIPELLLYAASSTLKSFTDWKLKKLQETLEPVHGTSMCSRQQFIIYHLLIHYFTIIHYFCRVKVYFSFLSIAGLPAVWPVVSWSSSDLPIWRLQDSSRPGQIQPWHSRYSFLCSMYYIQHCSICRPSDSTVSEDAGIDYPGMLRLRHWQSGALTTRLDLVSFCHNQTRKSFFVQTTDIACWSVNADHSLQVSQNEGLVGHRVLQSELSGETDERLTLLVSLYR